jgi:hypothetical protein
MLTVCISLYLWVCALLRGLGLICIWGRVVCCELKFRVIRGVTFEVPFVLDQ